MFKFVMSAVLAAMLGGMVATTVAQADSKVPAPQGAESVPFPASLIGTYSTPQAADNAAREYKARHPYSQVEIRKILGQYEVWGN